MLVLLSKVCIPGLKTDLTLLKVMGWKQIKDVSKKDYSLIFSNRQETGQHYWSEALWKCWCHNKSSPPCYNLTLKFNWSNLILVANFASAPCFFDLLLIILTFIFLWIVSRVDALIRQTFTLVVPTSIPIM